MLWRGGHRSLGGGEGGHERTETGEVTREMSGVPGEKGEKSQVERATGLKLALWRLWRNKCAYRLGEKVKKGKGG